MIVPANCRFLCLAHASPNDHASIGQIKDRMDQQFYWEGVEEEVANYIQSLVRKEMGRARY